MAVLESVTTVPVYYGGQWITPETETYTNVHNPSTGDVIVLFYTRQKVVLSRWDSTYKRQQGW